MSELSTGWKRRLHKGFGDATDYKRNLEVENFWTGLVAKSLPDSPLENLTNPFIGLGLSEKWIKILRFCADWRLSLFAKRAINTDDKGGAGVRLSR